MRPYLRTILILAGISGLILLTACRPSGGSDSNDSNGSDSGGSGSESFGEAGDTLTFDEIIEALLAKGEGTYRVDTETDLTILAKAGGQRVAPRNIKRLGLSSTALTMLKEGDLPAFRMCDIFNSTPEVVQDITIRGKAEALCLDGEATVRYFQDGGQLGYAFLCDGTPALESRVSKLSASLSYSLGQYSLNSTLYDDIEDASIQCGAIEDSYTLFEATGEGQSDQEIDIWTLNWKADYLTDQDLQVSATFSGSFGTGDYSVTDELFEVQQGGTGNQVYIRFTSAAFGMSDTPVFLFGESGTVTIQSISENHYQGTYNVNIGSPKDTLTGAVDFSFE
ncbi:hypothetical protein [Saccharospirillum salsuginis]|uniref:Lipoprotein n=1 Tax=Saccharospirillum salsuginis TaxID=418750 RepID=A0A918N653_9GAMM|nr:hypothetical protein [Saccharospirillum salsuginis]GGX41446.1 hypothetical protein GCM10007392_05450 [Saccharospirillum salsuginis]